jgi:uncharacterized protein YcfL
MKKVMFAVLALPFLAGCFWNKKADVVETEMAQEVMMPESSESSDMNNMVADESSDEK